MTRAERTGSASMSRARSAELARGSSTSRSTFRAAAGCAGSRPRSSTNSTVVNVPPDSAPVSSRPGTGGVEGSSVAEETGAGAEGAVEESGQAGGGEGAGAAGSPAGGGGHDGEAAGESG